MRNCFGKQGNLPSNCPLVSGFAPKTPPIGIQKRGDFRMDKVKVTVRLSSKEHAHLKKQADNAGLKMEPYIRRLIAGKEVKPLPSEELLNIYKELNHIGTNINQIARIANSNRYISGEKLNELDEMLSDIWIKIRSL